MNSNDFLRPIATVDLCIFTLIDDKLKILLNKREKAPYQGKWALPGGFIFADKDKNLKDTVKRVLKNKTGASSIFFEQVETLGSLKRDPRGWSITTVYFALIDSHKIKIETGEWFDIFDFKKNLAFDHHFIIQKCLHRLQNKSRYTALPLSLLPKEFTLTQAQKMYELILNHKQEKKGFRKRLIDNECVVITEKQVLAGKRHAALYKINTNYDYEFPRSLQFTSWSTK